MLAFNEAWPSENEGVDETGDFDPEDAEDTAQPDETSEGEDYTPDEAPDPQPVDEGSLSEDSEDDNSIPEDDNSDPIDKPIQTSSMTTWDGEGPELVVTQGEVLTLTYTSSDDLTSLDAARYPNASTEFEDFVWEPAEGSGTHLDVREENPTSFVVDFAPGRYILEFRGHWVAPDREHNAHSARWNTTEVFKVRVESTEDCF